MAAHPAASNVARNSGKILNAWTPYWLAGGCCLLSEKSVYVRLSDDYLSYILSTQNVDEAIKYMVDLKKSGAFGLAFEYDVVYIPVWSELQLPSWQPTGC